MRLIDKDALKVKAEYIIGVNGSSDAWHILSEIDNAEEIDAEPVRHGHWDTVEDWDGDEYYQCSECGAEFVLIDGTPEDNDYQYCPHCGARNVR